MVMWGGGGWKRCNSFLFKNISPSFGRRKMMGKYVKESTKKKLLYLGRGREKTEQYQRETKNS